VDAQGTMKEMAVGENRDGKAEMEMETQGGRSMRARTWQERSVGLGHGEGRRRPPDSCNSEGRSRNSGYHVNISGTPPKPGSLP